MGRQENHEIGLGPRRTVFHERPTEEVPQSVLRQLFHVRSAVGNLERSGVYTCGTVRTNCRVFSPTLKNPRLSERQNFKNVNKKLATK